MKLLVHSNGTCRPLYEKPTSLIIHEQVVTIDSYWLKAHWKALSLSMWHPRRWGKGAVRGCRMVVGFGLKTCVMWGLWQSAHNGLASLNSNLHSTQKNTHGTSSLPSVRLSLSFCLRLSLSSPTVLHLSDRLSIPPPLFLLVSTVSTPLKHAPYFCFWPSNNLKYQLWIGLSCTFRAFLWLAKDFSWLLNWLCVFFTWDEGFISQGLHLIANWTSFAAYLPWLSTSFSFSVVIKPFTNSEALRTVHVLLMKKSFQPHVFLKIFMLTYTIELLFSISKYIYIY